MLPGNVKPLCLMATMSCNVLMHPPAMLVGLAVCAIAAVDVMLMVRAMKAE